MEKWIVESIYNFNNSISKFIYIYGYYIILAWISILIVLGLLFKYVELKISFNACILKHEISKYINISIILFVVSKIIIMSKIDSFDNFFKYVLNFCIPTILSFMFITYFVNIIMFKRNVRNITKSFYNTFLYVTEFLFFISLFGEMRNIIMSLLGLLTLAICSVLLQCKTSSKVDSNLKKDKLYKCRQTQLERFHDIVQSRRNDNFAISICGEWGSGKTLFLKTFMNEYEKDNFYIYIKPMISDTLEGLINQFSKQLIRILKESGIYLSNYNSINKYFDEILKLISFNTKVSLNSFISNNNNEDSYIQLKEDIQNDINSLIYNSSKKIVVIIDDFDRIDEDKQEVILYFIKEIIDFKGCIVIFALDYINIQKNKKLTLEYMEKFVQKSEYLSQVDFDEIINYYADKKLDGTKVKNNSVNEILLQIKTNLCKYNIDIKQRLDNDINNKRENINKGKRENNDVAEDEKFLDKLEKYYSKRLSNTDNSRRIIHFLDNLQNTLELIGELYPRYSNGIELIQSINTSEIIYFFNYIKVFNKDIYSDLVKSGGVLEYIINLKQGNETEDDKLRLHYFKAILGNTIDKYLFMYDVEKLRDYQLDIQTQKKVNFINDIFVDYNFTVNNIQLISQTEILVEDLDNNNLIINDNVVESIKSILKFINNQDNEHVKIERIKKLSEYMLSKLDKEIKFEEFINLCMSTKNYTDIKNKRYFLEPFKEAVLNNKVKLSNNDIYILQRKTKYFEIENVFKYKFTFRDLLDVMNISKEKNTSLEKTFDNLNTTNDLIKSIEFYMEKNTEMEIKKDDDVSIDCLLKIINDHIDREQYEFIDFELLDQKINEFIVNDKLVSFFNNLIIEKSSENIYEQLNEDFTIDTFNDIRKLLEEINKEKVITDEIMLCFKRSISYVNSKKDLYDEIDEEFEKICENIYNKIDWANISREIKFYIGKDLERIRRKNCELEC